MIGAIGLPEVIIFLILGAIIYFLTNKNFKMDKKLKQLLKGRTAEQQEVIKYFYSDGGCLSKNISDSEYEEKVMAKVKSMNFKQKALDKLGVDESQVNEVEPIHFEGWKFDEKKGYIKYGKDKVWRSSIYQITWIFCSSEQVYVYQYTLNMDEDGKKEQTEEYFYKDITNFSSSSSTVEKNDVLIKTNCKGESEYGRRTVDTDLFKITVPGDKLECAMVSNDYTEGAIQGLKAKLREKKNL